MAFHKASYRRLVFHDIMNETFKQLYSTVIQADDSPISEGLMAGADSFLYNVGYSKDMTIAEFKQKLNESGCTEFITKMVLLAEACATNKAEDAAEAGLTNMDDISYSDTEKEIIQSVFRSNLPMDGVSQIRDAVSQAYFIESEKAEEIKKATKLIKEQNTDEDAVNESINRLTNRGPTSLMNALMMNHSQFILSESKTVIESGKRTPGQVLVENKENIQNLAKGTLALYETANVFGYVKFTEKFINETANSFFYNKMK